MNYDKLTHKIHFIWDENSQNLIDISRIAANEENNIDNYNSKKLYSLETEWEEMSVLAHYDINDDIDYYQNQYYKMYEITIENFPLKFLSYLDCCGLFKDPQLPEIAIYGKTDMLVYVYNLNTAQDMLAAIKTIKLYVHCSLYGFNYDTTKRQIYSKLQLVISNSQSYK